MGQPHILKNDLGFKLAEALCTERVTRLLKNSKSANCMRRILLVQWAEKFSIGLKCQKYEIYGLNVETIRINKKHLFSALAHCKTNELIRLAVSQESCQKDNFSKPVVMTILYIIMVVVPLIKKVTDNFMFVVIEWIMVRISNKRNHSFNQIVCHTEMAPRGRLLYLIRSNDDLTKYVVAQVTIERMKSSFI